MKDKRFQQRYIVLKMEDVKAFLTLDQRQQLEEIQERIEIYRKAVGKEPVEGIFIGRDWPEYEAAASELHNRITSPGAP